MTLSMQSLSHKITSSSVTVMVSQKKCYVGGSMVSLQIIVSKIPIFKLTTAHDNPSMGRAPTSSKYEMDMRAVAKK